MVRVACFCEGRNPGCVKCAGTGEVVKPACRRCGGKGKQAGAKCLDCRGQGWRSLDLDAFVDPKFIGSEVGPW